MSDRQQLSAHLSEQSVYKHYIHISIAEQRLQLINDGEVVFAVSIATAKNGAGEQSGSECTPRGWHTIRAKIGAGCPENMVFIARRATGEIYNDALQNAHPGRDWILTRILWLNGLQSGFNRSGRVDTMRRYIYIHGCPDSHPMGIPSSHGCIKMRNADIIALFSQVDTGLPVFINEQALHDVLSLIPE